MMPTRFHLRDELPRDSQSMAFFRPPGMEKLYSGRDDDDPVGGADFLVKLQNGGGLAGGLLVIAIIDGNAVQPDGSQFPCPGAAML